MLREGYGIGEVNPRNGEYLTVLGSAYNPNCLYARREDAQAWVSAHGPFPFMNIEVRRVRKMFDAGVTLSNTAFLLLD